ncbi:hypothetical protein SAMN05421595_0877 [Austwickia chelonae]|uniref:SAF domain-containing protein n=1 Tax=Austwickia chelonae NBRC 105200 TaxID=1184607 RepID=K6VSP2_9MICO|nr:hypothetical protein [Austwickia chelonae]GAB78360.1 hypothetical protein AUCHE_08_06070 [Austwickia chelonae NBRC 105200]SEW02005.1 hypothetical protein SAMN05421595_0877 [Austwickia chelonae]
MSESTHARRLRRPHWRDSRLLIGVLLIVASVATGARVVAAAGHTAPMYAATHALIPGERLTADRLTRVDVALGETSEKYLPADEPLPDAVVVREVRPGELLAHTAIAPGEHGGRTPVVIPVPAETARMLIVGSTVDIWINDKQLVAGTSQFGTPRKAVKAAPVGRVPDPEEGRLAGLGATAVQVHIPHADVERLVGAMDQGAKITLVPTTGSAQRDR